MTNYDPPHPLVAPAHTPTPRPTTPKAHTMTLNIDAMTDHHERLREERAADTIRQLAPTPALTPLADHARDKYLLAKANQDITRLLHTIARLEGIDIATARTKHLEDK